jgi:hypothetical protein
VRRWAYLGRALRLPCEPFCPLALQTVGAKSRSGSVPQGLTRGFAAGSEPLNGFFQSMHDCLNSAGRRRSEIFRTARIPNKTEVNGKTTCCQLCRHREPAAASQFAVHRMVVISSLSRDKIRRRRAGAPPTLPRGAREKSRKKRHSPKFASLQ